MKSDYNKLAQMFTRFLKEIKLSASGSKIEYISLTEEKNILSLWTMEDYKKADLGLRTKVFAVDKLESVLIQKIIEDETMEAQKEEAIKSFNMLFDQQKQLFNSMFEKKRTTLLHWFYKKFDNFVANFLDDFSDGIFAQKSESENILLIDDFLKKIAVSKNDMPKYISTIKSIFQEQYSSFCSEIQDMFKFCNIEINAFTPTLKRPQEILTIDGSLTDIGKGISIHPVDNSKFLVMNHSGNVKCYSIGSFVEPNQIFAKVYDTGIDSENSVDYSASGDKFLVSGFINKVIFICRSKDGQILKELRNIGGVSHAKWCSERIVVGVFNDGMVKCFNTSQENPASTCRSIKIFNNWINCLYSDKRENIIYFGDKSGSLLKLKSDTLEVIWIREKQHSAGVLAIHKYGNLLATGGFNKELIVFNECEMNIVFKISALSHPIIGISFSPNGEYIIITTSREILLLSCLMQQIQNRYQHVPSDILSMMISWINQYLVFGTNLGTIYSMNLVGETQEQNRQKQKKSMIK